MSGDVLKPGDVIQLGPNAPWGGCLAFVDEVRVWGVTANILAPVSGSGDGWRVGMIPIRVDTKDFKRVGAAQYFVALDFGAGKQP